jgi:hypothetical protein
MGAPAAIRNKGGNIRAAGPLGSRCMMEQDMDNREKTSNGPNDRPVNETIAGTGPGIPDDALAAGEELPRAPTDDEVRRIAEKMGAPLTKSDEQPHEGD